MQKLSACCLLFLLQLVEALGTDKSLVSNLSICMTPSMKIFLLFNNEERCIQWGGNLQNEMTCCRICMYKNHKAKFNVNSGTRRDKFSS